MTITSIEAVPEQLKGLQYRRAQVDDLDTRQRIITLRAVPYEHEIELVPGLWESFETGAFGNHAKDPNRAILFAERHSNDGGRPVGRAFDFDDTAAGPVLSFRVAKTPDGDNLLTLLEEKVLDEASSEFTMLPGGSTTTRQADGTHVRHRRAHLKGVAVVPYGAYGSTAPVLSVRDDQVAERARRAREAEVAFLDSLSH